MNPFRSNRHVLMLAPIVVALAIGSIVSHGSDESFRYPYERSPRGAVRQALDHEIIFYQERLRRDPHSGLNLAALAGAYLKMARATGDLTWLLLAEQTAHRSLSRLSFQNSVALLVLARVAEARHEFKEASRLARQAGGPDAMAIVITSALAVGKVDEASMAADLLVRTQPALGSYVLRGLVEMARGNDDAAIASLHHAIRSEEPGEVASSAWARTLLGRVLYRRGRLSEARSLYLETLRILPQYPPALLHLGELETRWRHYNAAEHHLTRVVSITRDSPNVYDHAVLHALARVKELQHDREGAARLWHDAESRLRQDMTAGQFGHRRELARLLLERGRPEDLDEALALMHAEVQIRRDAETLYVLAWVLSEKGQWLKAQRVMQDALRWGVRDARLFHLASVIERALGHHAQAERYVASAMQTDPAFDEHARRVLGFRF